MPHIWTSNDKTPTISSFPYMLPSEPLVNMSVQDEWDSFTSFGTYDPPTMAMRDERDEIALFPEQQHGMNQITNTYPSENFLDSYWRLFHPAFPIVHRPTFGNVSPSPMLLAAMIAVGGHYSTDLSVKRKSRVLHERCIKLLEQVSIKNSDLKSIGLTCNRGIKVQYVASIDYAITKPSFSSKCSRSTDPVVLRQLCHHDS